MEQKRIRIDAELEPTIRHGEQRQVGIRLTLVKWHLVVYEY